MEKTSLLFTELFLTLFGLPYCNLDLVKTALCSGIHTQLVSQNAQIAREHWVCDNKIIARSTLIQGPRQDFKTVAADFQKRSKNYS